MYLQWSSDAASYSVWWRHYFPDLVNFLSENDTTIFTGYIYIDSMGLRGTGWYVDRWQATVYIGSDLYYDLCDTNVALKHQLMFNVKLM